MKKIIMLLILIVVSHLFTCVVYGQENLCTETIKESLQHTAEVLNSPKSKKLWGISLNAPVIIIDHINNKMIFTAIEDGVVKDFKEEQWDNKVPLANSFSEYNGTKYVTVLYVALMNTSCEQRVNLMSHEIFHLHQNSLGIRNPTSTNYHMDEVQGRSLLRIEMKALQQVLDGDFNSLSDALYIRAYRQSLYPDNNEDFYELNEGLAEYTGAKLSMSNINEYIKKQLEYNISSGYTNAFGYFTGSAYAVVLDQIYPEWKKDKDLDKGMIHLIKKEKPQHNLTQDKAHLDALFTKYNYNKILSEEENELKSFGDITYFEELLKPETAKLCIKNSKIRFTYNPHDRVIKLTDAVLLRNMTVKGEWGQIEGKSGIVRLNNWSVFYLLPPKEITANVIKGDDYEIHLNEGWRIIEENKIYKIIKD